MSIQSFWFLIGFAVGLGAFLLTGLAIIAFACWRVRNDPTLPQTLVYNRQTGHWEPCSQREPIS